MSNNRDFVTKVIKKYKDLPCLWQVTHKDYHNKHKRNAALDEILQIFKTKIKDANRETVQKKIASMRASFKKELNKVQVSLRSGAEAGDVHVPKLWYYKQLLFISDVETPRRPPAAHAVKDELADDNDVDVQSDELSNTESHADNSDNTRTHPQSVYVDVRPPQSIYVDARPPSQNSSYVDVRPPSESSSSSIDLSSSYKRKKAQTAVLAKISDRLDRPKRTKLMKQKYSAYGEHVAEKLRNMSRVMAIHCQKLMNDAIYMAELECLDISARIVTNSNDSTVNHGTPSIKPS